MKNIPLFLGMVLSSFALHAQIYTLDASKLAREIKSGHLKMGNPGPTGNEIKVNSLYITIGGKPVIPVMGEFHYTRYPKEQWEDVLLKMKACGVNVVATYVFWIHHEELEGQFDWSGNKDLRAFVKLCQKLGLYVYPRLGPWCHGEVRNGGLPDWILSKEYLVDRTNHPVYQQYVDRLYQQIAFQLHGLYYKDGGPVIGVQLENEYWRGKGGEPHILWLKQTAMKYGIDVPLYTVTGWGNASVPQDEVIPLWGAYPEAPWQSDLIRNETNESFSFYAPVNAENIGNSQVKKKDEYDYSRFPFLTCELGIGNELTEHRRPIINKMDGQAIMLNRLATGSNLIGYYVFAGGSNPQGIRTSLEENRDETGYWNEYPDVSYDFQAAVKESGELALSYFRLKKEHYFLNEFGEQLAPMLPVLYPSNDGRKDLQLALRAKDNSAYLFGVNYYRGVAKPVQKNVQFSVKLKSETVRFPGRSIDIADSTCFIWPINLALEDARLTYATAQPLCVLDNSWIFFQNGDINPEFCFSAGSVNEVKADRGQVMLKGDTYVVGNLKPGLDCAIQVKTKTGKQLQILVLTDQQADQAWLFNDRGRKHFYISSAGLCWKEGKLYLSGKNPGFSVLSFGSTDRLHLSGESLTGKPNGFFTEYEVKQAARALAVQPAETGSLEGAQWIKASVKEVTSQNQLFHKNFLKEFSLENPSAIKSARMYFATDAPCAVQINYHLLNQPVVAGRINFLDITGYLKKGENTILLDYLFTPGDAAFAAKIQVEYYNTEEVELVSDQSWQTREGYTLPSLFTKASGLHSPELVPSKNYSSEGFSPKYMEWTVEIPDHYLDGLKDAYLYVDYTGDKARCRLNHRLIYDDFNNNAIWQMELKRFGDQLEGRKLKFQIEPLQPGYKILFDKAPTASELGKAGIKSIRIVPEYETVLEVD